MRRACWIIVVIAPLLAGAGRGDTSADIEKQVERLADQHHAQAAAQEGGDDADAGADCRWVTQTVTHQGAAHTRRVRMCQSQSWWSSWLEKARRTK